MTSPLRCPACSTTLTCVGCNGTPEFEHVHVTMPDGMKFILYVAASQADQFLAYTKLYGRQDDSEEN